MPLNDRPDDEWLEADGLGGFASGTVDGIRTRRYHALLLAAATPPAGRMVLVNGLETWVETPGGRFALSSQRYAPDVVHPDGASRMEHFTAEPFPTWTWRLEAGARIEHALFAVHGRPLTVLRWRCVDATSENCRLHVRLLLSGRDYHALHHENPAFRFDADVFGERTVWHPYGDVPAIEVLSNGVYHHEPLWFRNFQYDHERTRGLDFVEDLASPGTFVFDLSSGEAVLLLAARIGGQSALPERGPAGDHAVRLEESERRRRARFPTRLHRAADAYVVARGSGKTIVAGYPWFTDWGRDTFISLRGLCLATSRLDDARQMLRAWAGAVSQGMLPNRFPDRGDVPEYNSVDASLWYVVAVDDYLAAMSAAGRDVSDDDRTALNDAVEEILSGYSRGTRYGIRMDGDGLLAAGQPGVQLTWMDAKVGDWVVTPRIGKPVEIQALWLNALWIGSRTSSRWLRAFERGREVFLGRFWNEQAGCLYDVVDADHQPGRVDGSIRPNQILAAGGLPQALVDGPRAMRVVDTVEQKLWTPLGLRTLDPADPAYRPRCDGGVYDRDGAYHQGTAWAWLLGPFVDAWVRVRGGTPEARREARRRFVEPLLAHLDTAGLGHVSEIADGDPPHTPRGCPFQAWSVGELLRMQAGGVD